MTCYTRNKEPMPKEKNNPYSILLAETNFGVKTGSENGETIVLRS